MPTLTEQIHALDNATATRLLRAFARANSATEPSLALTSDIREGLEQSVAVTASAGVQVSEGDFSPLDAASLSERTYLSGRSGRIGSKPASAKDAGAVGNHGLGFRCTGRFADALQVRARQAGTVDREARKEADQYGIINCGDPKTTRHVNASEDSHAPFNCPSGEGGGAVCGVARRWPECGGRGDSGIAGGVGHPCRYSGKLSGECTVHQKSGRAALSKTPIRIRLR